MNSLAFATITDLLAKLEKKELSSKEILNYFIKRFEKFDPQVKAALEIFNAESVLAASAAKGPLAGIPGILKDNICQKDRKLTCASNILKNFVATYDATASKRLKDDGALLLGRANLDEFAMGSSTETSAFGRTYNPWDLSRVPGGSSGGSIAAVAAGLVPWALGSETGGSVRQPAGFCNLIGLKPTYGLISRYGLVAYASSLDQIGIATRTVKDNALILSSIAGQDIHDSSTLPVEKKNYVANLSGKIKEGLVIGVIENALQAEGVSDEVHSATEQAIKQLEKLGATIKRLTLPIMDYSAAIYFILSRAEAASNLARFDGVRYGYRDKEAKTLLEMYEDTRLNGFGKEVKARIMIGNYVLSVGHAADFYNNAKQAQRFMRTEFERAFAEVDLLLLPTAPSTAFKFGAFDDNKLAMDLQDYFTCSANIAGVPAISIPCGFSKENLPIGFQLMGPHLSEDLLYQTAYAYEQVTPWHTMYPKSFE